MLLSSLDVNFRTSSKCRKLASNSHQIPRKGFLRKQSSQTQVMWSPCKVRGGAGRSQGPNGLWCYRPRPPPTVRMNTLGELWSFFQHTALEVPVGQPERTTGPAPHSTAAPSHRYFLSRACPQLTPGGATADFLSPVPGSCPSRSLPGSAVGRARTAGSYRSCVPDSCPSFREFLWCLWVLRDKGNLLLTYEAVQLRSASGVGDPLPEAVVALLSGLRVLRRLLKAWARQKGHVSREPLKGDYPRPISFRGGFWIDPNH